MMTPSLFDLMDESLRFELEDHYPPLQYRAHRREHVSHLAGRRRFNNAIIQKTA
jgi:hypothetical protein